MISFCEYFPSLTYCWVWILFCVIELWPEQEESRILAGRNSRASRVKPQEQSRTGNGLVKKGNRAAHSQGGVRTGRPSRAAAPKDGEEASGLIWMRAWNTPDLRGGVSGLPNGRWGSLVLTWSLSELAWWLRGLDYFLPTRPTALYSMTISLRGTFS